MSNAPYYGPVDEAPSDILLEKTFLASGYLTGLGYGAQLVLYIACMRILWRGHRTTMTYVLLAYITVLCAMNTIWTGTSAYGLQLTFIDNRNYPGGVIAFLGVEFALPSNVASLTSYIVGNVLADGLLLWRCRVIWSASLGSKGDYLMIFPTLLLLASLAMGIAFDIETASPQGLYGETTTSFATPYFAISLSLNIILTLMIAGRILSHQRMVRVAIGGDHARHYTSLTTMFVESAAIYSVISVLLLVTYAIGHPINQIWLGIAPSVQLITSYLIIYRVAEGRAWSADTLTKTNVESAPVFRRSAYSEARGHGLTTEDTSFATKNDVVLQSMDKPISTDKDPVNVVRNSETSNTQGTVKFVCPEDV